MATITVSATLSAEECPLLSRRIREPVIVGKYDINASKHVGDNKEQKPAETTVPMLAYAANVLATNYGYKSVSDALLLSMISPSAEVIFAEALSTAAIGSFIYAYVIDPDVPTNSGHWVVGQSGNAVLSWTQLLAVEYEADTLITTAIINGRILIHVAGTQTYEFDGTDLTTVTLDGLTIANIVGIISSSGYLIAYTVEKPFWSSLSDPLDFVPSDITGAGSSNVQELQGDIVLAKSSESGFIMYTTVNAVYAVASNDIRFPFIFKEIKGVGGIASPAAVSYGQSQTHIVRSGSNLSKVSKLGTLPVMNSINTFINGTLIDGVDADFDIVETPIGTIDAQFLHTRNGESVFSFGQEGADDFLGLVYYKDSLNRSSKLLVPHKFALENPFQNIYLWRTIYFFGDSLYSDYGDGDTYESLSSGSVRSSTDTGIILVTKNGEVRFIDGRYEKSENSLLILGPFQLVRGRSSTLAKVVLQAANVDAVQVTVKSEALNGYVRTEVLNGVQVGGSVSYPTRVTGLNHLICISGSFDLSSVTLTLVPHTSGR